MEKRTILQRFMEWTRFDRLTGRGGSMHENKASKDVRLEKALAGTDDPAESAGAVQRVETLTCADEIKETRAVKVKKMSSREETVLRIKEGFNDLSSILTTINTNIEDQTQTSKKLDEKLEVVPNLLEEARKTNDHQGTLVETVARGIEDTELRQKEALKSLRALPVALAAIQENEIAAYKVLAQIRDELSKRTNLEEKMANSFENLEGTLKDMGHSAREQADQLLNLEVTQKVLVEDFSESQKDAVESFQIAQDLTLDTFRKTQNEMLSSFQGAQTSLRKKTVMSMGVVAAAFGLVLMVLTGVVLSAVSDLSNSNNDLARAAIVQERKHNRDAERLEREKLETVGQLANMLKSKQAELDILLEGSKDEMERFGKEHTDIVRQKNIEIIQLKEKLAELEDE